MKTPYELRIEGLEAGEASIIIELSQGNITVRHGSDGEILKRAERVELGSWDKIWDAINNIKTIKT